MVSTIDIATLHEMVICEADSGLLFWKKREPSAFKAGKKTSEHSCNSWNAKYAGMPAFSNHHNDGYLCGSILGKKFLAHRIVWAMHNSAWPSGEIDHINHDRTDNRIENLRDVLRSENSKNLSRSTNNPSGITGVYWFKPTMKWVAKLQADGKIHHLGYFKDIRAAKAARISAQKKYGFHNNHGEKF